MHNLIKQKERNLMQNLLQWLKSKKVNKKAFIVSLFTNVIVAIGILSMYIDNLAPLSCFYNKFSA